MSNPLLAFALAAGLFIVALGALVLANLPARARHLQAWAPVTGLVLGVALVVVYVKAYPVLTQRVMPLLSGLQQQLGLMGWNAAGAVDLAWNLLLLAGFGVLKLLVHAGIRVGLRFITRWRTSPAWVHRPVLQTRGEPYVVLRPEWFFPGLLLRWAGIMAGIPLMLIALLDATVLPLPFTIFALPAIPLLLLLETGWFLDGVQRSPEDEIFVVEEVSSETTGDFHRLWEDYQRTWGDYLLGATQYSVLSSPRQPGTAYRWAPENQVRRVDVLWNRLVQTGCSLTQSHYEVLEYLLDGRDLIIEQSNYQEVAPLLFAALEEHAVEGRRILVLVEADRLAARPQQQAVITWVEAGLNPEVPEIDPVWLVEPLEGLLRRGVHPHVLVATTQELLEANVLDNAWFDHVGVVVVLDVSATALSHVASVRALADLFAGTQIIAFTDQRTSPESGYRDILGGAFEERSLASFGFRPRLRYILLWRAEVDPEFQRRILPDDRPLLAPEFSLALPALEAAVDPVLLLGAEVLPWGDYLEELAGSTRVRKQHLDPARLRPTRPSWLTDLAPRPMLLIRDREYNLVMALREYLSVARDAVLAHVVSPPYLFRDYCADNMAYFLSLDNPPVMALVPRVAEKSRYTIAYTLLERLLRAQVRDLEEPASGGSESRWMSEQGLLRTLRIVDPKARLVEDALQDLFKEVFQIDLRAGHYLRRKTMTSFLDNRFSEQTYFWLDQDIKQNERLSWLQLLEVRDTGTEGGHLQGYITRDQAYQHFIPGQIHALHTVDAEGGSSKSYAIRGMQDGVVMTDKEDKLPHVMAYRPVLHIMLHQTTFPTFPNMHDDRLYKDFRVVVSHGFGRYEICTEGYFTFERSIDREDANTPYKTCVPPFSRSYHYSQILRIRLVPPDPLEVATRARVSRTLAVLLNEAKVTFFPETHALVWACSPAEGQENPNYERPLAHALPSLEIQEGAVPLDDQGIVVYVVEDAHADMGLVRCLFEERNHVLELLTDYLNWVLSDEPEQTVNAPGVFEPSPPAHEEPEAALAPEQGAQETSAQAPTPETASPEHPSSAGWRLFVDDPAQFLRYGADTLCDQLDLEATYRLLLQRYGGVTQMTRQRYRRRLDPEADSSIRYGECQCDFCGALLPPPRIETLSDGRQRCDACRQQAINTADALKAVYREARAFLVRDLRIDLTRLITVRFADAHQIARAQGRRFMPTAGLDPRAVGLAVWGGGQDFTIYVENGQPYLHTLAVIIHELTHIWQYTHLDYQRLHEDHGLLYIEGHATWTELQGVERRDPHAWLLEQTRQRTDIYGNGYRALVRLLEGTGFPDPFTWLLEHYPR